MRCPCTPGEVARWREALRTLAPERQESAIRMLGEAVADCPICERPVRRCDPRRLVDDQLVHVVCAAAPSGVASDREAA